jgi:hypothetical protein
MKMNKNLINEIIAAADTLDIEDLFDACEWLRSDGVTLLDDETGEMFNVIPQMSELYKLDPDHELTPNDSLERMLLGVMDAIKKHCRSYEDKWFDGSTAGMFFDNYKFWKERFDADDKAGKDHPGYDQLKLFALHETLADWLRFDMQDLFEQEKQKNKRSELKLVKN